MVDDKNGYKARREKVISYALAALLPIIIMGAAFALNGVYPLGGRQIIIGDFWDQYYPFISDFWHKLHQGNSLLWSWTAGAGHDYVSHIAYYLASPFNLLAALFPHDLLREVLTVFLLFKLGLAGLFMSLYLRYIAKRSDILLPVFASMYALCAFALGYYSNIMWLDTFALLPLVMLGVHKLVSENKFALYILALAAAVICNFYLGFFVCVFTAMWFFILCFAQKLKPREFLNKLALIAVFSTLAIGITAFLTLPAYSGIQHTYGAVFGNVVPDAIKLRYSFIAVLGNFIAFTPPTYQFGLPNLASGIISIMLLPLFFLAKKIAYREKLAYLLVLVFLIISTNVNVLDYIWHAFSYPAAFPSRYSFLISFVLIAMAYRAYISTRSQETEVWSQNNKEPNSWVSLVPYGYKLLAMGGGGAFFLIMAALGPQETKYIIWSSVLGGIYLCLFTIPAIGKRTVYRPAGKGEAQAKHKRQGATQPHSKEKRWSGALKPVIFALIIIELFIAAYIGVKAAGTSERENYPPENFNIQQLLDKRQAAENDFYRTDAAWFESNNDTSLYGYQGISYWSTLANSHISNYMEGLGLPCLGIDNDYYYARTSPLTNAFLNMRYLIDYDFKPSDTCVFWNRIGKADRIVLLENNHYLPLGFMVNTETASYKGFGGAPYRPIGNKFEGREMVTNIFHMETAGYTPFDAQNDLFSRATGLEGDLFSMVDIMNIESPKYQVSTTRPGEFSFTTTDNSADGVFFFDYKMPANGCLYVYVWVEGADNAKVALNSSLVHDFAIIRPYIYFAGNFKQGDLVSIAALSAAESGEAWVYAAIIDQELFEQGFALLADETLELVQFSDTKITGRITVLEDGLLYTSIPHAGLWKAFVDGNQVEIITVDGAMTAVWLEAGEHIVEFSYHNKALIAGIIISVTAVLVFLAIIVYRRSKGITALFVGGKQKTC